MYPTIASIMTPKPRKAAEPSEPPAPSYEQETTDFFAATSTPDDETVSIYGISNHECYELFDSVVKYWKSEGVWNGIHHWHPMFGGDAVNNGYNAKDVNSFYMNFFGSWVMDELGNKGNGSNTHGLFDFIPADHMTFENSGMTIVVTEDSSQSTSMELGSTSDSNRRTYLQTRTGGEFYIRLGDTSATSKVVPSALGVNTGIRKDGVVSAYQNGVEINSGSGGGNGLSQVESCYGDYNNNGSIGGFCSSKRMASAMHHSADNPEIIETGLRMWEEGLGRL